MKIPSGFTLLELIVVVAITGLIGVGVTLSLGGSITHYFAVERRASLGTEAELAMGRMVEDLRQAEPGINFAANSCVEFTTGPNEQWAFRCTGGELYLYRGASACMSLPAPEYRYLLGRQVQSCRFTWSGTHKLLQMSLVLYDTVGDARIRLQQTVHLEQQ